MLSLLEAMKPNSAYNLRTTPITGHSRTSTATMSHPNRRELLQAAGTAVAAAAASPLAAQADGSRSKATRERARQIYGSRIYRLQGASVPAILDEKGVFDIFLDGAYGGLRDEKSLAAVKQLKELQKTVLSACIKGDGAGASAAVKEYVKVAKISEQDTLQNTIFNPKQRRNAGAPTTDQIEDQMGSEKKALYGAMKDF